MPPVKGSEIVQLMIERYRILRMMRELDKISDADWGYYLGLLRIVDIKLEAAVESHPDWIKK